MGYDGFSLTPSGQVLTGAVLDREALCDMTNVVNDGCVVTLDIMCTHSSSQFVMVKLHVSINIFECYEISVPYKNYKGNFQQCTCK